MNYAGRTFEVELGDALLKEGMKANHNIFSSEPHSPYFLAHLEIFVFAFFVFKVPVLVDKTIVSRKSGLLGHKILQCLPD